MNNFEKLAKSAETRKVVTSKFIEEVTRVARELSGVLEDCYYFGSVVVNGTEYKMVNWSTNKGTWNGLCVTGYGEKWLDEIDKSGYMGGDFNYEWEGATKADALKFARDLELIVEAFNTDIEKLNQTYTERAEKLSRIEIVVKKEEKVA